MSSRRLKNFLNPRLLSFSRFLTNNPTPTFSLSSAFRLFGSLLFKALAFLFSMDDDFFSTSDTNNTTNFLDLDLGPSSSSSSSALLFNQRPLFSFDDDQDDYDSEKLYLVPYRWWSEAESVAGERGVRYSVSSSNEDDDEIVLDLREEEEKCDAKEEGFSGREYALVSESMWLRALKWHSDSKVVEEDAKGHFTRGDRLQDVFRIQIRLSVFEETNSLVVKIRLKDNTTASYKRACDALGPMSDLHHIWDFSGQTTQFLMDNRIKMSDDSFGPSGEEALLELYLHGFSEDRDEKINGVAMNDMETSLSSHSVTVNGFGGYMPSCLTLGKSKPFSHYGISLMGLTGLQNLGNTCFMNSAIQCLAHTPKLVDYFLGDYRKELNRESPLGMKGELALAFGELLRKLWAPGAAPVSPTMLKLKLANFASQFSGYNQHDSQEFLAFLLDGLHEDLNRVKHKPYVEAKDVEGLPDEVVAEEYWQNHLARNDSIIVDMCQGQYRSTLVCPNCKKKSVTFDPFMYLSLPLPSTTMRTMTVTVLSSGGTTLPCPVTVTVPKCGRLKDLIDALSAACSLRDDEVLLVVEVYRNKIFRFLEDPSDMLVLIRDEDTLVAYRLLKDEEASPLVVFMHQGPCELQRMALSLKLFGIPLAAKLSDISDGYDLQKEFVKLLNPFLLPIVDVLDDSYNVGNSANEDAAMEDALNLSISDNIEDSDVETKDEQEHDTDFQFHLKVDSRYIEIKMDEPLPVPYASHTLEVHVVWSDKMFEKYDTHLLSSLPEVFKSQLFKRTPPESVSLYKCLEAFLKEEPLGPDDMWYCPGCKKHRQAIKKLDLWRLPETLVVHLKRFSYSRFIKNKLETFVDFPINDFYLSDYVSFKDNHSPSYKLYAIINHYGGTGSGHYTAFVDHGHGKWYEFDDSRVLPVSEDNIKTSAAYVLFYRRVW